MIVIRDLHVYVIKLLAFSYYLGILYIIIIYMRLVYGVWLLGKFGAFAILVFVYGDLRFESCLKSYLELFPYPLSR